MSDLSGFREVFLEELEEQLQTLEDEILRLEQDRNSDQGIQGMFRAAHTLKGSSAAMGYDRMKSLTHEMENCLDKLRNHELSVTEQMISTFLKCLDRMRLLQAEIVHKDREESEIDDLIQLLAVQMTGPTAAPMEPVYPKEVATEGVTPPETFRPLADGEQALFVQIKVAHDALMKQARLYTVHHRLQEYGDVLWDNMKDPSDRDRDEDYHRVGGWLLATSMSEEGLNAALQTIADIQSIEVRRWPDTDRQMTTSPESSTLAEAAHLAVEESVPGQVQAYRSHSIRVNVDRLESLVNDVGELVIEQTRIRQIQKHFKQKYGSDPLVEELNNISDQLSRIVGDIQDNVMQVRMAPIEQLFNRFPRMVRDLASSLHKQVELILDGKETELDRSLMEEIGDPLIHLVRNAVDHGIEDPETRKKLGKPEKGHLHIDAAHRDNSVWITVRDDGAGIDAGKIRAAAVQKGIMSDDEAALLPDKEAIQLIFHSGFSTSKQLSDVSGRGVGMDIVRTEVERLNGMIEIETVVGQGTEFRIRLPLTLAIITGLLIGLRGKVFILPMSNVVEIVRIEQEHVKKVKGTTVLSLRDQIIPLIWLHDVFNMARSDQQSRFLSVVIIGRAEKKVAVVVDELRGNQEIVIKSLGSMIGKLEGITGATILGDGQVALILEAGAIVNAALRTNTNTQQR